MHSLKEEERGMIGDWEKMPVLQNGKYFFASQVY
jgi:hypothetical protein